MMLRQRVTHMWRTGQYIKPADSGFHPRQIYVPGVQGAVYRPRDLSTLFLDYPPTAPVTGMEQQVATMLDISGNGNHAFQTTAGKRPVVSRRVNLLLKTDSPADWGNHGVGFEAGSKAPDGGTLLTAKDVASAYLCSVHTDYPIGASPRPGKIIRTIEVKGGSAAYVYVGAASANAGVCVRLADGVVELASTASFSVVPTTDGYWRITVSVEDATSLGASQLSNYLSWGAARSAYIVDAASRAGTTIYVRNPSYIYTGVGDTTSFPYQWVNTATDYDDNAFKFPTYLRCDGAATAMQTNAIDFTGTDKMTVWAGITKLSDAAAGIVCELSANLSINSGVFSLLAPVTGSTYGFYSKGTVLAGAVTGAGRIAPHSSVLTGIGDISGDRATLRELSVQTVQTTTDQGTGNYGNHPLHIGARGGTLSYLNGRLYSLIVAGAQMTPEQLAASEAWMAAEMMVPA